MVAKALGSKPMVAVGLISYSLYLWHWPIIVYAKLFLIHEPELLDNIVILLLSFFSAYLSWRFIESPFRTKTILKSKRALLITAFLTSLLIIIIGLTISAKQGYPERLSDRINIEKDDEWKKWDDCQKLIFQDNKISPCIMGDTSSEPEFILWG